MATTTTASTNIIKTANTTTTTTSSSGSIIHLDVKYLVTTRQPALGSVHLFSVDGVRMATSTILAPPSSSSSSSSTSPLLLGVKGVGDFWERSRHKKNANKKKNVETTSKTENHHDADDDCSGGGDDPDDRLISIFHPSRIQQLFQGECVLALLVPVPPSSQFLIEGGEKKGKKEIEADGLNFQTFPTVDDTGAQSSLDVGRQKKREKQEQELDEKKDKEKQQQISLVKGITQVKVSCSPLGLLSLFGGGSGGGGDLQSNGEAVRNITAGETKAQSAVTTPTPAAAKRNPLNREEEADEVDDYHPWSPDPLQRKEMRFGRGGVVSPSSSSPSATTTTKQKQEDGGEEIPKHDNETNKIDDDDESYASRQLRVSTALAQLLVASTSTGGDDAAHGHAVLSRLPAFYQRHIGDILHVSLQKPPTTATTEAIQENMEMVIGEGAPPVALQLQEPSQSLPLPSQPLRFYGYRDTQPPASSSVGATTTVFTISPATTTTTTTPQTGITTATTTYWPSPITRTSMAAAAAVAVPSPPPPLPPPPPRPLVGVVAECELTAAPTLVSVSASSSMQRPVVFSPRIVTSVVNKGL